jgi:alpha-tubulin suppressor-like RCC1 family protein
MGVRIAWVLGVIGLVAGCDKLFSLTHVNRDADVDAAPCQPRSIATGRSHSCSVDFRGDVYCWGNNDQSQVAQSAPKHALQPLRIILPVPAAQVVAGRAFTCARLDDGSVWCWGNTAVGQLGGGATSTDPGPIAVAGIPASAEISAGGATTCSRSVDDGSIWCWGSNRFRNAGQTIDVLCGNAGGCVTPSAVPNTTGSKALALGHRHACVIDSSDHIACWGRDDFSQLGDNNAADERTEPGGIAQLGAVAAIGAGGRTSCAIAPDGALQCWGEGYDGDLANGATSSSGVPVTTLVDEAQSVAIGHAGGCALLRDHTVRCWGDQDAGDGTGGVEIMPVTTQLDGVTELATHFEHTCAIAKGDVYCWGLDNDGQLGRGDRAISAVPVDVGLAGAIRVSAGEYGACAETTAGLRCWGQNTYGELGAADLQTRYSPVPVDATISPIEGLVAAHGRMCVWGGGRAQCWGHANSFSLGNGIDDRGFAQPQPVQATTITHLALGFDHMCVALVDDTVTCYGYNGNGQLGTPFATLTQSNSGFKPAVTNVTRVAAGARHSCALSGTSVYCWGSNDNGQLGDGTKINHTTPAVVPGLLNVTDVAAGGVNTCALDSAGAVWCWGKNSNGELGDGSGSAKLVPTKTLLPSGRTATAIAIGPDGACAILDNATTYCWGDGEYGQVGDGQNRDTLTPVAIPEFAGATQVSFGTGGTCARLASGRVMCTGDSRYLANGDASRSVPMLTAHAACGE